MNHAAWYYKKDGETLGPVSTEGIQDLLVLGQLEPRQPVWQHKEEGSLFVRAETAVRGYLRPQMA